MSPQLSCGKCITCTIRIGSKPARREKKKREYSEKRRERKKSEKSKDRRYKRGKGR